MPDISLIALIGGGATPGIVCSAYKASRFGALPVPYDTPVPSGAPDATAISGNPFGGPGQASLTVPTFEEYWVALPSGGHIGWVKSPSPLIPESDVSGLIIGLALKAPLNNPAFTGTPWNDPKAFGAIGDGGLHPLSELYGTLAAAQADFDGAYAFVTSLAQTRDWAGIQAAMNAGKAFIPEGWYKVSDTLKATRNRQAIEGAGPGTVISGTTSITDPTRALFAAVNADNVSVKNLTIDCAYVSPYGFYVGGVSNTTLATSAKNCRGEGVTVLNQGAFAFLINDGATDAMLVDCLADGGATPTLDSTGFQLGNAVAGGPYQARHTLTNCHSFNSGGNGFDGSSTQGNLYNGCVAVNNGLNDSADPVDTYGFFLGGDDCRAVGCYAFNNKGPGFSTGGCQGQSLDGCVSSGNRGEGLWVRPGQNSLRVSGSQFRNNARAGAKLEGTIYVALDDCSFFDNGQSVGAGAGDAAGIWVAGTTTKVTITDPHYNNGLGVNKQTKGLFMDGTSDYVQSIGGSTDNVLTPITLHGTHNKVRDLLGYNPVGAVTTPAFPATTVAVTNSTGSDVVAYITNGVGVLTVQVDAVTALMDLPVNGVGTVRIPAGSTFTGTYAAGVPTWKWYGE